MNNGRRVQKFFLPFIICVLVSALLYGNTPIIAQTEATTYYVGAYGEGDKPLLLGSVERNDPATYEPTTTEPETSLAGQNGSPASVIIIVVVVLLGVAVVVTGITLFMRRKKRNRE